MAATGRAQEVDRSPVIQRLHRQERARQANSHREFASPGGGPVSVDKASNAARLAAKLSRLYVHGLRHPHAAVAVNGSVGSRVVAGWPADD